MCKIVILFIVIILIILWCSNFHLYNDVRALRNMVDFDKDVIEGIGKRVDEIDVFTDGLADDLTKTQTHTRDALTGSYCMVKELEKKFNTHYHSYKFENGILYVQEPIINESEDVSDEETPNTDEINADNYEIVKADYSNWEEE